MIAPEILESLQEWDEYLKLSKAKIFQFLEVEMEVEQNLYKPAYLALATHGLFLYEKNEKMFTLLKTISHIQLMYINIAGDTASFSTDNDQIKVKSPDLISLAIFAYIIRESQFPSSNLPLNIHVPSDLKSRFESPQPYSDEIFTDRIITCCFHTGLQLTDEILTYIEENFGPYEDEVYNITNDILGNFYIKQIMLALSFESCISTLYLKNIKMIDFFKNCSDLLVYDNFVKKIVVDSCSFQDFSEELKNILAQNRTFCATNWIFKNCECDDHNFPHIFSKIHLISKEVKILEFYDCKFEQASITDLFSTILFEESYHTLEKIKFVRCDQSSSIAEEIALIISSDWVSQHHNIFEIDIDECKLDSSTLILKVVDFNSGIKVLRLRYSNAERYIDLRQKTALRQLSFLDLRHSKVSSQNLINLFQIMESGILHARGLDLSDLEIFPPIPRDLYEHLADNSIFVPSLECLFYDDNLMRKEEIFEFRRFICLQKNLKFISLNNSISCKENPNIAVEFLSMLLDLPHLDSISIRSKGRIEVTYGELLKPILEKAAHKKMKMLDLTGQHINSEGLKIIKSMVLNNQIKEIYFDECRPSSLENLLDLCSMMLKSGEVITTFPIKTFQRCDGFYDGVYAISSIENSIREAGENMKNNFSVSFGDPVFDDDFLAEIRSDIFARNITDYYEDVNKPADKTKKCLDVTISDPDALVEMNLPPDVEALFKECMDGKSPEYQIVNVLQGIAEQFTVDAILKSVMN